MKHIQVDGNVVGGRVGGWVGLQAGGVHGVRGVVWVANMMACGGWTIGRCRCHLPRNVLGGRVGRWEVGDGWVGW